MTPPRFPRWISWFCLISCSSCSENARSREDARRVLLQGWGEEIFVPQYEEFEIRAGELHDEAVSFCEDPDEAGLEAVQEAWWNAREPWKRNELLAFGPYVDPPARYGPAIDFWPAREESIISVLEGDELLDDEAIDAMGATSKGFPAIEFLLYQPELEVDEAFAETPRRCSYLTALTKDLEQQARGIQQAWNPSDGNYLGELVEAGRDSEAFDSIDMALGEVVNRLVFTIENIRGDKLGAPLGNRDGGTASPESVESRFSGRSLEDIRDALRGVREVCLGRNESSTSLASYLKDTFDRDDLAEELEQRFDDSFDALGEIEEPLSDSVVSSPETVQAAIDVLAELQRLTQVDVINAMGLTLTFNDADGD